MDNAEWCSEAFAAFSNKFVRSSKKFKILSYVVDSLLCSNFMFCEKVTFFYWRGKKQAPKKKPF